MSDCRGESCNQSNLKPEVSDDNILSHQINHMTNGLDLSGSEIFPNSSAPRWVTFITRFFRKKSESLGGNGGKLVEMVEKEVSAFPRTIEAFSRYLPTMALFEYWMLEAMIGRQKQYLNRVKISSRNPGTEPIELKQQNPIIDWSQITPAMVIPKLEKFVQLCADEGVPESSLKLMKIDQVHLTKYIQMQGGSKIVPGPQPCNYPFGCPCNSNPSFLSILGRQEDHVHGSARGGQQLQSMCGLHNRWKSSNPLFNLLSYHHEIFQRP